MSRLRRFWPLLAIAAAAALLYFELRRSRGVTAENAFWLLVGGLVLILAGVDLWQSWQNRQGRQETNRSNADPPDPV